MRRLLQFILIFVISYTFGQTKVGNLQFNDIDVFEGTELMLNGAGKKDNQYAIGLYLDFEVNGVEDGIMVAEKDATMALTLKATSNISNQKLKGMVRNGLERATDGNSYLFEDQIRKFLAILPEKISEYQIFKLVYTKDQTLIVYKNQDKLGTLVNSLEFKQALFKIWLGENPEDVTLKEDLLGSFESNPVLGQWKTFDKKTGVAISVVQLYVIKDWLYGSVNRMLRQSERDAICYECQGDDKNQKVEGLVILKRLRKNSSGKYVDGKLTDIKTGEIVDCQLWIDKKDENILHVKYKGSGGVLQWKKVKESTETRRMDFRTAKGF